MRPLVKQRLRFFIAVEGESEQSFIAWLQMLAMQRDLSVHLDAVLLGGGGFKSMLEKAVREHKKRCRTRGEYRSRFLIVDEDRAGHGDWSIDKLRSEAARYKITLCVQRPNHEGLLFRMQPGQERNTPSAAMAGTKLRAFWPDYQKPANARTLSRRYSCEDVLRVADIDADLGTLLETIGLRRSVAPSR